VSAKFKCLFKRVEKKRIEGFFSTLFPSILLNKLFSVSFYGLVIIILSACGPAEVPPQFAMTPGMAVVIADERYQSDVFSVAIPEGWRVVTSEVQAPLTVTLVAPDDCALIVVSTVEITDVPRSPVCQGETRAELRTLALGDVTLWVGGSAPTAQWDEFMALYEGSYSSITNSP
jgi:hypothetical protein